LSPLHQHELGADLISANRNDGAPGCTLSRARSRRISAAEPTMCGSVAGGKEQRPATRASPDEGYSGRFSIGAAIFLAAPFSHCWDIDPDHWRAFCPPAPKTSLPEELAWPEGRFTAVTKTHKDHVAIWRLDERRSAVAVNSVVRYVGTEEECQRRVEILAPKSNRAAQDQALGRLARLRRTE